MIFHGAEVRQNALALLNSGIRSAEVARRLQVPRGTVSYWLHMDRSKRNACPGAHNPSCHRCDGVTLAASDYVYLLGLYLGDGHISQYSQHRVPNLMITLDDAWPGVQAEAETSMRRVFPDNATCRVRKTGCHNIKVYSKHLPCLFPQHGPGRKHERKIELEAWQQELVDADPLGARSRTRSLRRLQDHQLDDTSGRRRAQAIRVSEVLVHQCLGRHPPASTPTPWTSLVSSGRTAPARARSTTSP